MPSFDIVSRIDLAEVDNALAGMTREIGTRFDFKGSKCAIERLGPSITPQALKTFARQARKRMRTESGGYRRDHLRALAQRVEVDAKEVRIMGSKSVLLRTLVAASSAKRRVLALPVLSRRDSNS